MRNLIGNKWADSASGRVIEVINPATNELIDTIPNSTPEDVEKAVSIAKASQVEWAKTPVHERAKILMRFTELVYKDREELATLLSNETGKTITEARAEVANVQIGVPAFVEKAKHLYGEVIPEGIEAGQEKNLQIVKHYPLGVVVAIIPFNFPLDLFCQKVPAALLMGNSVIIKPSTYNPLTLTKFGYLLRKAGVPEGVVEVIHGEGKVVGQALASSTDVALVSLTGSTSAGIETMETCSRHLHHVMLELGGNDAFIVLEDADIDLAVEEVMWGRFYNTGQVCCASKRFLVQNKVKEEFTKKLIERTSKIKRGDLMDDETEIGCLITADAAKKVEEQVNLTVKQGGKIVLGGKRDGAFYDPTIITDIPKDADVMKDMEIFGPVVSICGFEEIDEAIEIANSSIFGLCGCVFSRDMKKCAYVSEHLEVGGAVINGASFYRAFEMPFGGWKYSGIGNEGVMTTLEEMSRKKTTVLKNIF